MRFREIKKLIEQIVAATGFLPDYANAVVRTGMDIVIEADQNGDHSESKSATPLDPDKWTLVQVDILAFTGDLVGGGGNYQVNLSLNTDGPDVLLDRIAYQADSNDPGPDVYTRPLLCGLVPPNTEYHIQVWLGNGAGISIVSGVTEIPAL